MSEGKKGVKKKIIVSIIYFYECIRWMIGIYGLKGEL
ncbi:hypothetical protein AEYBE204_12215 [Asticcacaulis sp. YBE204]|nr:hypothetical protein AEYBE204_12215 [Asticcacaulis sp. YBE204]